MRGLGMQRYQWRKLADAERRIMLLAHHANVTTREGVDELLRGDPKLAADPVLRAAVTTRILEVLAT